MKILYLSSGNIPSWWAHSYQIMRMSEALSQIVSDFTLITGTGFIDYIYKRENSCLQRKKYVWEWYGIRNHFHIHWIPISWRRYEGLFGSKFEPRFTFPLIFIAKLLKPDVVFTRDVTVAQQCLKAGLRVIFEFHMEPGNPVLNEVCRFSSHKNLLGIITLTNFLKKAYINIGMPEEKILPLYSGVDIESYKKDHDRIMLRKKLKLPLHNPMVIFTGTLAFHKGIELLLETAVRIPHINFVFVGGPQENQYFWENVTYCVNLKNAIFTGIVKNIQIPDYLQAADICVISNQPNNKVSKVSFPLKLLEYMASRRPIIVTQTHCLTEDLIQHEKNALSIPYTVHSMSNAITTLVENPLLAKRLAYQAYEDAQQFSWKKRALIILQKLLLH